MAKIASHAGYLSLPLLDQKTLIKMARSKLRGVKFDTFVGRGVSGCLACPILARAMRKDFLIVRKPGDGSHSSNLCEGQLGERWVFVDDLIASGETAKAVGNAVAKFCRAHSHQTEFVGAFLYDGRSEFRPALDLDYVVPRPDNRPDNWSGFYQAAAS